MLSMIFFFNVGNTNLLPITIQSIVNIPFTNLNLYKTTPEEIKIKIIIKSFNNKSTYGHNSNTALRSLQ